jgi:hypothetical protein
MVVSSFQNSKFTLYERKDMNLVKKKKNEIKTRKNQLSGSRLRTEVTANPDRMQIPSTDPDFKIFEEKNHLNNPSIRKCFIPSNCKFRQ